MAMLLPETLIGDPELDSTFIPCLVTRSPDWSSEKLPLRVNRTPAGVWMAKKPSPSIATSSGFCVEVMGPAVVSIVVPTSSNCCDSRTRPKSRLNPVVWAFARLFVTISIIFIRESRPTYASVNASLIQIRPPLVACEPCSAVHRLPLQEDHTTAQFQRPEALDAPSR